VREKLKDSYSEIGRPSIDPELLFRILLIGYLYGVTSESKLVEELHMHLAGRWFTDLVSTRRFRTTRPSRRIGTVVLPDRICLSSSLRR
jgi:transposase